MKQKLSILALAIFLSVVALFMSSCVFEPTYTVWTETDTYAEYIDAFGGTLNDGYFIKYELTYSQWYQITKNLSDDGRHFWGKTSIKTWFMEKGFSQDKATETASWLVNVDHGLVVKRSGSLVYLILK